MSRQEFWKLVAVVVLACGLASAQTITTFDAPGAGTGSGQGTLAEGISAAGTTYGYYFDSSGVAQFPLDPTRMPQTGTRAQLAPSE